MKTVIRYQLQLTSAQAEFLADDSYGHNRMEFFLSLVKRAALKPYPSLVVGSTDIIDISKVERSISQLHNDWGIDPKTARDILKAMNDLGMITTESSPKTTTHVIHVVAAWYVDNICIHNPYFNLGYEEGSVHNGEFDSTAIAEEFTQAMNESITAFKEKVPKGGRGKKKLNRVPKVYLPNIIGLEMYEQDKAKQDSHSDERVSQPSKVSPSELPQNYGTPSSDVNHAHCESDATTTPSPNLSPLSSDNTDRASPQIDTPLSQSEERRTSVGSTAIAETTTAQPSSRSAVGL